MGNIEFSGNSIFEHIVKEYTVEYDWKIKRKEKNRFLLSRDHLDNMFVTLEEKYTEGSDWVWVSVIDVDRSEFDDLHDLYFRLEGKNFVLRANPYKSFDSKLFFNIDLTLLDENFNAVENYWEKIIQKIEEKNTVSEIKKIIEWFEESVKELKQYRLFFVTGLVFTEREHVIQKFLEHNIADDF